VIRINFGAQDSELILQVLKLGVELLLDQFQLDKYHDSSIRIFIRECKVKVTAMYINVYTAYRVRCSLERPGYKNFCLYLCQRLYGASWQADVQNNSVLWLPYSVGMSNLAIPIIRCVSLPELIPTVGCPSV
jgi:hypothetical protein